MIHHTDIYSNSVYYVSGTFEETFIKYISPLSHNDIQINPGTVVEAYQDACKLHILMY